MSEWVLAQVSAMPFSGRRRFWRELEARIPRVSTGERIAWPDALLHLTDADWEAALRASDTSSVVLP